MARRSRSFTVAAARWDAAADRCALHLSLPSEALDGTLRLTEQGEVLAERYDDVQIAYRHLEQVTCATLIGSTVHRSVPEPAWTQLMQRLSSHSLSAYRELVDQPGFIQYFVATTPIEEIEDLPIGSRPARAAANGRWETCERFPGSSLGRRIAASFRPGMVSAQRWPT